MGETDIFVFKNLNLIQRRLLLHVGVSVVFYFTVVGCEQKMQIMSSCKVSQDLMVEVGL